MAIRIVLIEENLYDCLLLACALENNGINVADTSNSLSEVSTLMKKHKPDVAVFSLDTHAIDVMNAAHKARKVNSEISLVFLTNVPDIRLLGLNEKELPRGAVIIVRSSLTTLETLVKRIEGSIHELAVTAPPSKSIKSPVAGTSALSLLQSLTQVQIETLRLVAMGSSNAEIARARLVTEKAVEHTITRMLQALKIAANSRHNARVLLSREYFRWVDVDNQSPKLVP